MRLIDADELMSVISDIKSVVEFDGPIEEVYVRGEKYEKVQRGEWEEMSLCDGDAIEEWQEARCSVCGRYHTTPYVYYFNEYSYCPNCGAKMDKE